jgi:hypothetical protein
VGALFDGTNTKAALTRPVWINDGETKPFRPEDQLLFDARVPEGNTVRGGLVAFDEDYAKDWAKHGDMVNKITNGVAVLLAASGNPGAVTAGGILKGAVTTWSELARLDLDDNLGSLELTIPASGPGAESKSWDLKKGGWGLSTWNYTIRYRITRTFPQLLLRVSPSTIPTGRPVQVTVSAEDAETHARVTGVVKIDGREAGKTDTPFSYTFAGPASGTVTVPDYPETSFTFNVRLPRLLGRVTPYPVPLGKPVQVTVHAEDAETHARVAGVVKIDGVTVGNTDTPFTFTFHARRRNRPFPGLIYPQGAVIAPNYEDARIEFGFGKEENLYAEGTRPVKRTVLEPAVGSR